MYGQYRQITSGGDTASVLGNQRSNMPPALSKTNPRRLFHSMPLPMPFLLLSTRHNHRPNHSLYHRRHLQRAQPGLLPRVYMADITVACGEKAALQCSTCVTFPANAVWLEKRAVVYPFGACIGLEEEGPCGHGLMPLG